MKRVWSPSTRLVALVMVSLLVLMFLQIVLKVHVVYKGMSFPFGDLVGISSASECLRAGLNPYLENPIDPFGRTFNYPTIWLFLADLFSFEGKDVVPVGLMLLLLFSLSVSFLFQAKRYKQGLLYLAFILSPPVLLLLERGNIDSVLFMLVALMTVYMPRLRGMNPKVLLFVSAVIILLSSLLKLYPLVLLPMLIMKPVSLRHRMTLMICTGLLIAAYLVYSFDVITLITHNTPQPKIMAYGKNVLMEKFFSDGIIPIVSNSLILLVLITVGILSVKGRHFVSKIFPSEVSFQETIPPYVAGALIFIGTFIIGNNYFYRLVFLLLTLPYLLNQLAVITAREKVSLFSSENSILFASLLLMVVYGTGVLDFLSSDTWRTIDWCMVGLLPVLFILSVYPCFQRKHTKWTIQWMPLLTILQVWMLLIHFYGYRMGEYFISWYAIMGLASWGLLLLFLMAVVHFLVRHMTLRSVQQD